MSSDADLLGKMGLDVSDLKRGTLEATQSVKDVGNSFKELKNFLSVGGIAALAAKLFSGVFDAAKESAAITDKNVMAVNQLGEQFNKSKEQALKFGIAVVGSAVMMKDAFVTAYARIGSALSGANSDFERTETLVESTGKSLATVQAGLVDAKKHASEFAEINKSIADTEQKRADLALKGLSAAERLNQLANDYAALQSKLENFEGTALERRQLILDTKKAELAYAIELAASAAKQRADDLEAFEQTRKADLAKVDDSRKLKIIAQEIADIQAITTSGALSQANTEQLTITLKARQKELAELTGKVNEEERKHAQEHAQKVALSLEDELQLFALERKAKVGLNAEEKLRLDLLRLQKAEKTVHVELEDLEGKIILGTITPAEKERLAVLIKQDDKLKEQILTKQKLVAEAAALAGAEADVTKAATQSANMFKDGLQQLQQMVQVARQLADLTTPQGAAANLSSFGGVRIASTTKEELKGLTDVELADFIREQKAGIAHLEQGRGTSATSGAEAATGFFFRNSAEALLENNAKLAELVASQRAQQRSIDGINRSLAGLFQK